MSHLSLHGDGNFGPQPVQRDGKKYSDRGAGVGGGGGGGAVEQNLPRGAADGAGGLSPVSWEENLHSRLP